MDRDPFGDHDVQSCGFSKLREADVRQAGRIQQHLCDTHTSYRSSKSNRTAKLPDTYTNGTAQFTNSHANNASAITNTDGDTTAFTNSYPDSHTTTATIGGFKFL